MNVIDKRYENTISFDSLKVGDTFIDVNDDHSILYMKIVSVDCGGCEFNAVNLSDGHLLGYSDDCYVVEVEAEVMWE